MVNMAPVVVPETLLVLAAVIVVPACLSPELGLDVAVIPPRIANVLEKRKGL